jgi:hypothetical protein
LDCYMHLEGFQVFSSYFWAPAVPRLSSTWSVSSTGLTSVSSEGPDWRPQGGEWEPIKILFKELGLCPKIKPTKPALAQLNCQGYAVIKELVTLGTILGSRSGSTNQWTKANRTTPNQTGSPWHRGRVTRQPPEPKQVTRHKGAGHPPTNRTETGHPD